MQKRRLAAIMFTDIVGYTTLMGSDEDRAFDTLRKNREIHAKLIQQFNGKLIKEMGDGMLISFDLASDAVRCAIEIQKTSKENNIPLKIGIHEGEMVIEGNDVLGDGVNIASRLQENTKEGCINISGSVYRDIKNKTGIKTEFIEEKSFKNVDEPIKVYQVFCQKENVPQNRKTLKAKSKLKYYLFGSLSLVLIAFIIWQSSPKKYVSILPVKSGSVEVDKSIAVLPFTDMSPNEDQKYFCDGVLEEILMHLYKIGDLRVIPRTSVIDYNKSNKNSKEIGRELGVANILTGSIRKDHKRFRITVQLIDTAFDGHRWVESYDGEDEDIFSFQSEISQKIASSLKAIISQEVKQRIETIPTDNMIAYDFYLKGNEAYWNIRASADKTDLYKSIANYKKAIDLDDNFSLAYTGLGRSYWKLSDFEPLFERKELIKISKEYLSKAINLDPYNGWAFGEMATALNSFDWDSAAIRNNLEMAIKLMPNNRNVYISYYHFEAKLGNCDKVRSLKEIYKKIDIKSDHPFTRWNLLLLYCEERYQDIARIAVEHGFEKIEFNNALILFNTYIAIHDYPRAKEIAIYLRDNLPTKALFYWCNGVLKALEGKRNLALAMCDSLENLSSTENIQSIYFASIYGALGDKDKMYKYLNQALETRENYIHFIRYNAALSPYQDEEQFQEIIGKLWMHPQKTD